LKSCQNHCRAGQILEELAESLERWPGSRGAGQIW
jgi:hypothetical protein